MGLLLTLVRIFGPVIHSTLSAGPSVGVDLQAEQRFVLDWPSFVHLNLLTYKPLLQKLTASDVLLLPLFLSMPGWNVAIRASLSWKKSSIGFLP